MLRWLYMLVSLQRSITTFLFYRSYDFEYQQDNTLDIFFNKIENFLSD